MSRYYYDNYFPKYVSVGEKKAKAGKSLEKLKKKNSDIQPVIIEGTKIANSWWGKAWCGNLENYADYSNRIGRGRSYVRNGSVLDLKISEGEVNALVQGSRRTPYKVNVKIKPVKKTIWKSIHETCAGKIESLSELIDGKFPKELEALFKIKGKGLFPSPQEIEFNCSCPDWASMCKHVAAVLYGIGARLDDDPKLFFILRKAEMNDLIAKAVKMKSESMLQNAQKKTKRVMDNSNLSEIFGINLNSANAEKTKNKPVKIKKPLNKKTNKNKPE